MSPEHLTLDSDDGDGREVSSERGSTGVESSLRCCYTNDCEDTEDRTPTGGGVSCYSRPFPLEDGGTSYSTG